jgi:glycosyltransferase involved in cell wall biosynthesis
VTIDDKALRLPPLLYKPLRMTYSFRYRTYRKAIQEVIQQNENCTPLIIFPPSLNWHSQLFQRPQQLALALAQQGAIVFYIQPVKSYQKTGMQQFQERLFLCDLPTGSFSFLKNPIIYLLTWNSKYRIAFHSPRVIYDYVDELDAFEGNRAQMERQHLRLLQRADWVLATAERLYQQALPSRPGVLLCPNGADYDFITSAIAHTSAPPADMLPILSLELPVIGYYGALAHWFDYDLLKSVAIRRNDLSFVLIGPDTDGTLHQSQALRLANIHWLGVKAYTEIPGYLRYFDAAMIPFCLNDVTHATSPLKLFEYMAGGKPVVITPMAESMRYSGVIVAGDAADFSLKLDQALTLKQDPEYLSTIDQIARENTWNTRALQILDSLIQNKR